MIGAARICNVPGRDHGAALAYRNSTITFKVSLFPFLFQYLAVQARPMAHGDTYHDD